jgi:hypothetical protein
LVSRSSLVVAGFDGFGVGDDGVGVGGRQLGARHRHVDVVAGVGGDLDADAVLEGFLTQVGAPRPGGDGHVHGGALGGDAHLFGAVEGDRAQVAGFELVGADDFELGFHQDFLAVRNVHHVDLAGVEQTLGVLGEAEDRSAADGVVRTDALENGQAVVEGVGEHVGGCLTPRNEFAVVPDETVAVCHRHGGGSPTEISKFKPAILAHSASLRTLVPKG